MLHDAVVVKNYLEKGSKWAVLIPCDKRKEASGTAQFLNSMIREAAGQENGEEKLIVLSPDLKADEP